MKTDWQKTVITVILWGPAYGRNKRCKSNEKIGDNNRSTGKKMMKIYRQNR